MFHIKKVFSIFMAVSFFSFIVACNNSNKEDYFEKENIKNVILLIGDGMGPNHIKMGEVYKEEKLLLQTLPQHTFVETRSENSEITDSAAAATAYATGKRTYNGRVGRDSNDENDFVTIVDLAKEKGKRTGVITTEELYGATPMGFSGHATDRGESKNLLYSAATTSNVDLFASYLLNAEDVEIFTNAGYTLIEDVEEISESSAEKVVGTYTINSYAMSMTANEYATAFDKLVVEALDYLAQDEDGFFLMAEGAKIDKAAHSNDIDWMLRELFAFDDVVKAVVNWAKARRDTLVVVTADHETGGLQIKEGITKANMYERARGGYKYFSWSGTGHTATDVCLYSFGPKIDFAKYSSFKMDSRIANIDFIKIAMDFFL